MRGDVPLAEESDSLAEGSDRLVEGADRLPAGSDRLQDGSDRVLGELFHRMRRVVAPKWLPLVGWGYYPHYEMTI